MLATGLADPELLQEDLVVMLAQDGMMSRTSPSGPIASRTSAAGPSGCCWCAPGAAQKRFGAKAQRGRRPPRTAPRPE